MKRLYILSLAMCLFTGLVFGQQAAGTITAKIAAAKAGETVLLPAGEMDIANVIVPPGVKIAGSGYDKTYLTVKGQCGLILNGKNSGVSNLTVQGADSTGIQLNNADNAVLTRVRVLRSLTGILATGGKNIQIVNCAAAENRTGIVINNISGSAVINCSLVRNSALGISVNGTGGCAIFNNVMATNAIGIFIAQNNKKLIVDHNVYWGALIGKGKDISMPTIASWRNMERQDAHSAFLPLLFTGAEKNLYIPAEPLPWALDSAMTSGWAVTSLAGFKAPKTDINNIPWQKNIGAGAWTAAFTAPRAADGTFTIKNSNGYKSAGLYDAQNRQVCWLFNMLPLAKGKYAYWLPSKDWQGRPITAGSYSLRIIEADLSLKYIASPGNAAIAPVSDAYASTGVDQLVYDSKERPILCLHWSESYRQFRAMDGNLQRERWMIPGCNDTRGAASDGQGHLYSLREADNANMVLGRIDEETGRYDEVAPGDYGWYLKKADIGDVNGITVLNGIVYIAATGKNKLLAGPKFDTGIDIASPTSPCADRERNLLWVLSNRAEVIAVDAAGAVKYRFTPDINSPYSLAVNGNHMALLSPQAGKVYLYDITNPGQPKLTRSIGTGDGPFGEIRPDRFTFQVSSNNVRTGHSKLAINSMGTVAVTDINGVKLFNWDGTVKRDFSGIWGQYIEAGTWEPGKALEIIDLVSLRTMKLDEKKNTVSWGTQYSYPQIKSFNPDTNTGSFFIYKGVRYGIFKGDYSYINKDGKTGKAGVVVVARYDTAVGKPLVAFGSGANGWMARFDDFSKDFNNSANWSPIVDAKGQALNISFPSYDPLVRTGTGDILYSSNTVTRIPFTGIDKDGKPVYDLLNIKRIRLRGDAKDGSIISPYDYTTKENEFPASVKHAEFYPDNTIVSTVYLKKTGHGMGLCNWSGTEVAGFGTDGVIRWLQPMASIKDPEGTKIIDDLSYSVSCPLSELQIVDKDGLMAGVSGAPREMYWNGMWLDNSHQFTAFKGNTGKHYICFGNFNDCTAWWMEVQGTDKIIRASLPVTITDEMAKKMAVGAPYPVWRKPENTSTVVKIAKLSAPAPIDGDLAKWRKSVPTPQIIITPETGSGIDGPADCSALVRLAHENGNLYVQVIRFDNLITMHQPLAMFYKQDALEMAINSFTAGIKINVTHTRDRGDIALRDGWFIKAKELDPVKTPRIVKVLDNARDIEERKIIEQIYGVDLSACKVSITEFMTPLDDELFESRKEAKPAGISGSTMALGIGIDDNDSPGADLQKMMVWPATYGTFLDKAASATVIFE